ncbi:MAG: hypothetical protein QM651_01245 [Rhodoblastus sp.]
MIVIMTVMMMAMLVVVVVAIVVVRHGVTLGLGREGVTRPQDAGFQPARIGRALAARRKACCGPGLPENQFLTKAIYSEN